MDIQREEDYHLLVMKETGEDADLWNDADYQKRKPDFHEWWAVALREIPKAFALGPKFLSYNMFYRLNLQKLAT